jgi:hypothetical protein
MTLSQSLKKWRRTKGRRQRIKMGHVIQFPVRALREYVIESETIDP